MIVVNFDPVDNNIFVLVDRTIEVNFGSASPDSGGNLKSDGSVEMDAGYEPTAVQQIATLKTVQDNAVGAGVAGVTGDGVDNTDPANPVMSFPAPGDIGAEEAGAAAAVQGNLDTHEADAANPHGVSAAQAGADPAGSAASVQGNLDTHEADAANPHGVSAAQAGADPSGSASAVQGNLDTHEADTANPHGTDFADLSDKDRAIQAATAKGNISGAVVFDMIKSIITCTLTGDVTGVSFINNPGDHVSNMINVYQDATGSRTIDWMGSGVHTGVDEVAADFQPQITASSLTKYWLFWEGTYWTITKREISVTAL